MLVVPTLELFIKLLCGCASSKLFVPFWMLSRQFFNVTLDFAFEVLFGQYVLQLIFYQSFDKRISGFYTGRDLRLGILLGTFL